MSKEFPLLQSRKFWIAIMDVVFCSILYFGAKYLAPGAFEDVSFLIGVVQVPVILVITALTVQNSVAIANE